MATQPANRRLVTEEALPDRVQEALSVPGAAGVFADEFADKAHTHDAYLPTSHLGDADPHTQYIRKTNANLGSTDSFNNLSVSGTYSMTLASSSTEANGVPVSGWQGNVFVTTNNGQNVITQMAISTVALTNNPAGTIWTRSRHGASEWRPWRRVVALDEAIPGGTVTGTGMPNGTVAAPVGSRYIDTAATNGAIEWIKAAGTGATGWQVVYGDTGWRDISDGINAGWSKANAAPLCRIKRVGSHVYLEARLRPIDATVGTPKGGISNILNLPSRFRPGAYAPQGTLTASSAFAGVVTTAESLNYLSVSLGTGLVTGVWAATDALAIHADWEVTDVWPATLPGTAA